MVGPSTLVINLVQQKQTSRLKCLVLRLLTSDLGSLFYVAKRPSETCGSKLSPKPSLCWLQPTLERPTLSSQLQLTVVHQYPNHYHLCKASHTEAILLFLHVQPPCGNLLLDPPLQTAWTTSTARYWVSFDGRVSAALTAILGWYLWRTDIHPHGQRGFP